MFGSQGSIANLKVIKYEYRQSYLNINSTTVIFEYQYEATKNSELRPVYGAFELSENPWDGYHCHGCLITGGFLWGYWDTMSVSWGYHGYSVPSGKHLQKAIDNGHRNGGFTHKKLWFSIVMLVYQRVSQEHENEKWLDKPRFFPFRTRWDLWDLTWRWQGTKRHRMGPPSDVNVGL